MSTKQYKPTSPALRQRKVLSNEDLDNKKPFKKLVTRLNYHAGRSNGKISVRSKGGRGKVKYRKVSFVTKIDDSKAIIKSIEYDPYRSSNICLISFQNGTYKYVLHPEGLKVGSTLHFSNKADIKPGNVLQLKNIPTGSNIFNIELSPGKGAQIVRSAGSYAVITAKNDKYVTVKLPSGEVRLIFSECIATIGQVSNSDRRNTVYGKAGAKRWIGKRPKVRGSAMNPNDHPHGGGEGKAPIGKSSPVSPQGKKALGFKTRKKNKSNNLIISRRK